VNLDSFGQLDELGEESEGERAPDKILQKDDFKWDINPRLKLCLRIKMLELQRKRKSVFACPINRLS